MIVDRIAAGNSELLARSRSLGPRIVDAAALLLADGPIEHAAAASTVLAANVDALPAPALFASYLQAFDRHVLGQLRRE